MSTQTINIKIDGELKREFNELAKAIGLTSSALLTMFIKRAVDEQAIPFEVKATNRVKSFEELNPVLQKMWVEDKAIEMGLLPDDTFEMTDDYFDKIKELYK
jgi:DNA-damage-inducible protein J